MSIAVIRERMFGVALALVGTTVLCGAFALARTRDKGLPQEGARARFTGSNQEARLDCAQGDAAIAGSNNQLIFTGACRRLLVVGSRNKVTIAFGKGAGIEFVGSNNAIVWTTVDGQEPAVRQFGSSNTVSRGG